MNRRGIITAAMWLLALCYPAFSFLSVWNADWIELSDGFRPFYLLSTVLLLPPALMLLGVWLGTRRGAPAWGWTFVLLLWIGCVGYLHYLFTGIAAGRI